MNRFLRNIAAVLGCIFLAGSSFCQEKVTFMVSGREHGQVAAATQNGTVYVDVQKIARKLGAGVELFARSKQAKITTRGFYAILTANSKEVLVNATPVSLPAPVIESAGTIMAPVAFFLLPQFQQAVGKELSFADGVLAVERRFDFARAEHVLSSGEDQLVFETRRPLTWKVETPTAQRLRIVFPETVIKRDESFRLKNGFISSVSATQNRNEAVLNIKLGKQGKFWDVATRPDRLIIRVGAKPLSPLAEAAKPQPVPGTPQPEATPKTQTPAEPVQAPSVLEEDWEEMPAEKAEEPAPAPSQTVPDPVSISAKPNPVMTAAPAVVMTAARKKMRIVVDPGHGGKDPGAVRSRVREKDLNLAVSKELFKLLKKGGFEVKITRDNDTFIALSERSRMANNFKADLFVSVHTNATKNKQANGFQVYFRSEKATDREAAETAALENEAMQYEEVHYNFVDALLQSLAKNEYINESSKLAGYVRNAVYKQPGIGIAVNQNNSVRQANFYVLKGVQSPAILVEMGYISSQKDRGRLTQSAVQKKMAQGIYNGIYNYARNEGWIK